MRKILTIGLVVNPLAGLGGSLARKGSDDLSRTGTLETLSEAQRRRAEDRAVRALGPLRDVSEQVALVCWGAQMGGDVLQRLGLEHSVVGESQAFPSRASDTLAAVKALKDLQVDILLFVGGDGTARDVYDVLGESTPVLGVPAGVKMHSGVFAVSPEAAGELLLRLVRGGLVGLVSREVRDIDEEAFRMGRVKSRYYGEMLVPGEGRYLQHTKIAGRESPELVASEIGDWLAETMNDGRTYLIGPGSTTAAIMQKMGLPNTLLGVDVVRDGEVLLADADEAGLIRVVEEAPGETAIVVTAIGGQGHIFGRGNQQLSAALIRKVGAAHVIVVAAKSKISALEGRPLLVDTNDPHLDRELCGWRAVITGYDDQILYRVATMA